MGTNVRATLSTKNPYFIGKHRYYELVHFCRQYPEWQDKLKELDGMPARATSVIGGRGGHPSGDPTFVYAEARLYFSVRIRMIQECAKAATAGLYTAELVKAVTEGISYDKMEAMGRVHCGKDNWYDMYRHFFWLLDKERG